MITNKDISIDSENGKITLNGNKYDLGTQGEIDTAVKDVYSVMGQMGAKNLLSYPYYTPDVYTTNGITFTVNEDRSVTATGKATANAQYSLHSRAIGSNNELRVKNGNYIISDGGLRNVNTEIQVGVTKNGGYQQLVFTRDGEAEFTINGDDYAEDSANLQITLVVRTGATTPVTFKPMLRIASDTDNTYQLYAKTNKQLTDQVTALDTELSKKVEASSNDGACNGALVKVSDSRMIIMIQNGGSATGENNMRLDVQTDKLRWQIYKSGTWTTIKEVSWDA